MNFKVWNHSLRVFVRKPGWKTGLARSRWPKWPGHSVMFPAQVWQREDRSTAPCRGSMRPPSLGRPPSYVSGYLNVNFFKNIISSLCSSNAWENNVHNPRIHECTKFDVHNLATTKLSFSPSTLYLLLVVYDRYYPGLLRHRKRLQVLFVNII